MIMHKERFFKYIHPIIYRVVLVLVICVVSIPACAPKGGYKDFSYLADQRYPPKPPSAPIEITFQIPDKPYILIGEVAVRGQIGLQTAVDQLKAMARDMGGDAIINYRSYRAAPGTPGAGYLVAQGRVVRWK
jgi:hypothetical protein